MDHVWENFLEKLRQCCLILSLIKITRPHLHKEILTGIFRVQMLIIFLFQIEMAK